MIQFSARRVARYGGIGALALLVSGLLVPACQPRKLTTAELERLRQTIEVHQAYARGDCGVVLERTRPPFLEDWEINEMLHSVELVRAYCFELQGDATQAMRIYRELIREAPHSFAADDARERRRALNRGQTYASRPRPGEIPDIGPEPGPVPLERQTAPYPPVARSGGIEGFVVVGFGVTAEGRTVDSVVLDSHPPFLFEGSSLRTVRDWTFEPSRDADPSRQQLIRLVFKQGDRRPDAPPAEGRVEAVGP
ncbi:MAG: TonB family protein [Deltaproteobacteria bacterium]|jgi:TonB family protein|nr:TonB family protein [Deltaproteobacteria bacterium]